MKGVHCKSLSVQVHSLLQGATNNDQCTFCEKRYRRVCGSRFPKTLALTGFMTPKRGSRTLFWKDPLKRHVFLNIYALSEANRDSIIKLIESFNPSLIFGYSSALGELASIARDSLA